MVTSRPHLALVGRKALDVPSSREPTRTPSRLSLEDGALAPVPPAGASRETSGLVSAATCPEDFLLEAVVQPVIDSMNETAAELERLLEKLRG